MFLQRYAPLPFFLPVASSTISPSGVLITLMKSFLSLISPQPTHCLKVIFFAIIVYSSPSFSGNLFTYHLESYSTDNRPDFDNDLDSDIDILVVVSVSKEKLYGLKKILWKITNKISLEHDEVVSLLVSTEDEYLTMANELFYRNVEKDGIELYGRAS